jgi:DNA helicase-2/ATP-dependent DNA helicase PcrA
VLLDSYPWCSAHEADLKRLFAGYVAEKQRQAVLDFDDLLLYWAQMMEDPALARHVGARFDHVLVDEYQDTNRLQEKVLLALKPDGRGLTVVGDDAQSIYSFRAAEVQNILGFPRRFEPPARVIALERNYRSTQPILDASNAVIALAAERHAKELWTDRASSERPQLVTVEDESAQARWVADRVLAHREAGLALKAQAVLFRTSHHSAALELELARRNIPFVKFGGLQFLEAAHVKDVLSVLRWADNPRNTIAAARMLQLLPGFGPANAQKIIELVQAQGYSFEALKSYSVPQAMELTWRRTCELMTNLADPNRQWQGQVNQVREWYRPQFERLYEHFHTRVGDLDQLELLSGQYPNRERFLTELTLDPPNATSDLAGQPLLDEDYLTLSTIHSSKGMEWDTVFLLNVVDGSFPNEFATGKPELIEEERRLLYVGMTRAQNDLLLVAPLKFHLTHQQRNGDAHVYGGRSRFLTEKVLKCLEPRAFQSTTMGDSALQGSADTSLDVGARLKEMW